MVYDLFVLLALVLVTLSLGEAFGIRIRLRLLSWLGFIQGLISWYFSRVLRVMSLILIGVLITVIGAVNLYLFGITDDLPDLDEVVNYRPKQTGTVYDVNGGVIIEITDLYREVVTYNQLPETVLHAMIAAEDKRYYTRLHFGMDVLAWPRVLIMNADGKTQGGSTITQQVARNLFLRDMLDRERTDELLVDNFLSRRLEELVGTYWANKSIRKTVEGKYAIYLEPALTDYFESIEPVYGASDLISDGPRNRARRKMKDLILTVYANHVYLGDGVYGFPYGARRYFAKSLRDLEPHEAALLASFIPYPGHYASIPDDPERKKVKLREMMDRRNTVLRRMQRNDFLTEGQMVRAMLMPVDIVERRTGSKTIAPAAVHKMLQEVPEMGVAHSDVTSGFARPHLTIIPDLQEAVNNGIRVGMENFKKLWPDAKLPQHLVVMLDNETGAILAMDGGRLADQANDYSSFNRATMSIRQPGSTFKGIDVLAAVRNGVRPSSIFEDRPYPIYLGRGRGTHWVSNYDGRFRGPINVREIIAQSRNVPTLRMVDSLKDPNDSSHRGIDEVIETARILGLSTDMNRYITTALGADGVNPLEFANAYRAIASGLSAEPFVVRKITDERGRLLAEREVRTSPLPISPAHLRTTQELLLGTTMLPRGTGRGMSSIEVPCAGKTGTSNDHRDAWFICFTYGTKGITILAWVGYDDFGETLPHQGRPKATGGSAALPIVRSIMEDAYGDQAPLGRPPRFPRDMEQNIAEYQYWYYSFPKLIE